MLTIAVLGMGLGLGGCGSTMSQMPGIGVPPEVPRAPEYAPATPPVGLQAPSRPDKPMSAAERAKLEAELTAARTHAAERKRKEIMGEE